MFTIKLADRIFSIDNKYGYIEKLCRDYIIPDQDADIISVSDKEIQSENTGEGVFSDGYLESLAIYRKICDGLRDQDILLFHCSAILVDEKAYLFTAPSGTGKSTHVRLWKSLFGDRVKIINDDKPLLRFEKDRVFVYGTPYAGKHNLQNNISAEAAGIIVLHQAKENKIKKMTEQEAFPMLINQSYRGTTPDSIVKTINLVKRLSKIDVYSLGCNISNEAVELVYNTLKGNDGK